MVAVASTIETPPSNATQIRNQVDESVVQVQEDISEIDLDDGSMPWFYRWIIVNPWTSPTDTPQEPGARPRRKRNLTTVVQEMMDNRICADEGCETVIEDEDLLRCGACNLVVMDFPDTSIIINTNIAYSIT